MLKAKSSMRFLSDTIFLSISIVAVTGAPDCIQLQPNDTVSSLYNAIYDECSGVQHTKDISIVVNGKIILKLIDDHRTIDDIGMTEEWNEFAIIERPDYVALLEMVVDINNIEAIPWFKTAAECLSDSSGNDCQTVCKFENRLDSVHCDEDNKLIGINLSHLNLSGTIHLESLPQSVRSLDLSFNDINKMNLDGLRGKSLEKLNIEHNRRYRISHLLPSGTNILVKELRLSSYQIFPETIDFKDKVIRFYTWRPQGGLLTTVIMDGVSIGIRNSMFYAKMVQVVHGITNKERIPWYRPFMGAFKVRRNDWHDLRVQLCKRGNHGARPQYKFDLSGMELRGHIDLGSLPGNVVGLDLSNNNLESISLPVNGEYNLRELDLRNNENLRFDLMRIDLSSTYCCLCKLQYLSISPNHLSVGTCPRMAITVQSWLKRKAISLEVVNVDDIKITRNGPIPGRPRCELSLSLPLAMEETLCP